MLIRQPKYINNSLGLKTIGKASNLAKSGREEKDSWGHFVQRKPPEGGEWLTKVHKRKKGKKEIKKKNVSGTLHSVLR